MRVHLFCHIHLYKMPEKHFQESMEHLGMYAIMKLEYEAPIYDGFGFGANFKRQIKSVILINQSSNNKCSLDSLQWNIKWDGTHLVLYSWETRYLVNYKFCELQGLKGVEN